MTEDSKPAARKFRRRAEARPDEWAVAEEVFFRGMLQRTLARSLPIWPAMIVTSVLFGVSHFQPLQLPALAAFGLVLSLLVHRSGRLGPAIWAHVGFNATTVVALLLAR